MVAEWKSQHSYRIMKGKCINAASISVIYWDLYSLNLVVNTIWSRLKEQDDSVIPYFCRVAPIRARCATASDVQERPNEVINHDLETLYRHLISLPDKSTWIFVSCTFIDKQNNSEQPGSNANFQAPWYSGLVVLNSLPHWGSSNGKFPTKCLGQIYFDNYIYFKFSSGTVVLQYIVLQDKFSYTRPSTTVYSVKV